jgi:hypothetical protein
MLFLLSLIMLLCASLSKICLVDRPVYISCGRNNSDRNLVLHPNNTTQDSTQDALASMHGREHICTQPIAHRTDLYIVLTTSVSTFLALSLGIACARKRWSRMYSISPPIFNTIMAAQAHASVLKEQYSALIPIISNQYECSVALEAIVHMYMSCIRGMR